MSEPISCFVDTNVLLYLKDARNSAKRETCERWLEALARLEAIVISPQSVNEFCNVVQKRFDQISDAELLTILGVLRLWCTAETVYENAVEALELQGTMYVSYYDGVLLSSALRAGCTHFLSEDLQHGRRLHGMRIVNPFEEEPVSLFSPS